MVDREELRRRYQAAQGKRAAPWETPAQQQAVEQARAAVSDLSAMEVAAVTENERRAYEEFMARRPSPLRLDPATWSLGKRLMIVLRPWRYRWSRYKAGLARSNARQKFFEDYFAEHGRMYHADLDEARKKCRALDKEMYPQRLTAEREMTEVLEALYAEGDSVEEMAEFLGARQETIGFLLGLYRERRPIAEGGDRWVPKRSSGRSGSTWWLGSPGSSGGGFGGSSAI